MATTARAQSVKKKSCPGCGSEALDLGPGRGPHKASVVCTACGRFMAWVGFPIDADVAAAFVMPFGAHKGKTMAELPPDYVAWLAANVAGRIGKRARVLLGRAES
jgi:hypothetical protein